MAFILCSLTSPVWLEECLTYSVTLHFWKAFFFLLPQSMKWKWLLGRKQNPASTYSLPSAGTVSSLNPCRPYIGCHSFSEFISIPGLIYPETIFSLNYISPSGIKIFLSPLPHRSLILEAKGLIKHPIYDSTVKSLAFCMLSSCVSMC